MALRAVGALGRVGHASRVVRCASRRTAHTARMPMQNRRVLLGCARWVSTPTHLQDESSDPAFATENDVEFVVRNLLYNHPDPEDLPEDPEGQVLSVLVEDEPGVLSRVASLLSGRGHNIKSLSVSPTNIGGISRMTLTVQASVGETRKIVRQIESVEEVLVVLQSSRVDSVHREVVLLKMSTEFHNEVDEATRVRKVHEKRRDLKELADLFKGEIIDVGKHHVTIILTSWPKRIDALVELARPYGIVETARSGVVAMPRSKVATEAVMDEVDETLSLSQLPPS
eukprot:m.182025 g.182025  ORF g.182025 m.182025 type:complete len:284 (-) comp14970_c0_seq6:159-1010(-)